MRVMNRHVIRECDKSPRMDSMRKELIKKKCEDTLFRKMSFTTSYVDIRSVSMGSGGLMQRMGRETMRSNIWSVQTRGIRHTICPNRKKAIFHGNVGGINENQTRVNLI